MKLLTSFSVAPYETSDSCETEIYKELNETAEEENVLWFHKNQCKTSEKFKIEKIEIWW